MNTASSVYSFGTPALGFGLTKKQKECLDFIKAYVADNNSISPSFQEICDGIGLHSKSGVHRLVNALEERGLIRLLRHRKRSIVLVENFEVAISLVLPVELDQRVRLVAGFLGLSPEKYIADIVRDRLTFFPEQVVDPRSRMAGV